MVEGQQASCHLGLPTAEPVPVRALNKALLGSWLSVSLHCGADTRVQSAIVLGPWYTRQFCCEEMDTYVQALGLFGLLMVKFEVPQAERSLLQPVQA